MLVLVFFIIVGIIYTLPTLSIIKTSNQIPINYQSFFLEINFYFPTIIKRSLLIKHPFNMQIITADLLNISTFTTLSQANYFLITKIELTDFNDKYKDIF